ncbi:ead/Ea22-like family protein [Serratia marcescens]|uniref:Ead/Ea22-like family protein n=1 Tax=Serratia marcescens TaxID=615 RepID=A0A5C7BTS7_SERMA|nr:ead/Ea22-like family protein [Serratia marcescens]TXE26196.1 ead/Ea22-like family protein [Serratia marcescens]TXE54389.1 ead/Ea22-like family protein [Serratia marcescens]
MDKFSELKAAAIAATPGQWILDDDSWSEGDNANVSTEERYDGRIVSIAQIEGGGSESGFDEPFSAEQQANARYIAAANPAVVLALLAELEAKDERIGELEAIATEYAGKFQKAQDAAKHLIIMNDSAQAEIAHLKTLLATPVWLPDVLFIKVSGSAVPVMHAVRVKERVHSAGFKCVGDE